MRIRIFHGKIDVQIPFSQALELADNCNNRRSPLAGFTYYNYLGHGFSKRQWLRGWRDTNGPVDTEVVDDVVNAALKFVK